MIVEIERILPGGHGLAHAEDLTIFVPLTAPGDTVRIEIDRVKGKIGFGRVTEIINPSLVRIEPPCPYFGRCGGCDFQQLTYTAQLQAKVDIIRDCLQRIAQLKQLPPITIEPSRKEWQYRSRALWHCDPRSKRLGYFEAGSRRICDVEYCAVLDPKLERVLEELRLGMLNESVSEGVFEIDAVAGDESISVNPELGGYALTDVVLETSEGTYEYNARSFFQVNQSMLELLLTHALAPLGETRGKLALDLYCGVGLFTLPLAKRFDRVIGIEANDAAVKFAKRNLRNAGLTNVQFVASRVGEGLSSRERPGNDEGEVDFLLLDPPRAGAERSATNWILKHKPKAICYVSCDPATLARDLKRLLPNYSLQSITALDLFPQTHHVETVVQLSSELNPIASRC